VARIGGGTAHVFYAPMIVDDAQNAAAIRRQADVADAMALVPSVTIAMVAIGARAPDLSTGGVSGPLLADGPMPGGTASRGLVHRVGNTVRRPVAPCRAATHALLAHLASAGFDGAPRVLAADEATETLTYLDGRAGVPPMGADMLTDAALVSVGELLRRYHQAVASFDPAGYRWPRRVPARFTTALVSHNDVHPAKLIFRDAVATALIDAASAGHPGFIDCWGRVAGTMARARRWCEAHHRDLLAAAG
jgi:hypothetical protein